MAARAVSIILVASSMSISAVASAADPPAPPPPPKVAPSIPPVPLQTRFETQRVKLVSAVPATLKPKIEEVVKAFNAQTRAPLPKGKAIDPKLAQRLVSAAGITRDTESIALLVALEADRQLAADIARTKREVAAISAAKACKLTKACIASLALTEMTAAEAEAERQKLAAQKDAIDELNAADMFFLQQATERKRALEEMISNAMKASSDSQNAQVGALKAS